MHRSYQLMPGHIHHRGRADNLGIDSVRSLPVDKAANVRRIVAADEHFFSRHTELIGVVRLGECQSSLARHGQQLIAHISGRCSIHEGE
jgi:hypothetical protein